ncbi:MAG: hypothetical protein J7L61_02725 [Thermoplasmata archaeon]|nr:hypothetical protein [Thermoplasmata archaeon]
MNTELAEVIKLYSTGSHQELHEYLIGKSKDTLIAVLTDLITMYINDKNSSTIREFLTVTLAGYSHVEQKIGYNGFKQESIVPGKTIKCEAKPKNVRSVSPGVPIRRKLNGGGNFTDYTFERLKRDSEEDLNMLVSGFVDGRLIYIIEFPFNCDSFVKKIKSQLERRFSGGKDITGQFLRSANFNYKDYIDCPNKKIVFVLSRKELERYRPYIVKGFYETLWEVAE